MPSFFDNVTLDGQSLEVEVQYTVLPWEPDVGIMSEGAEINSIRDLSGKDIYDVVPEAEMDRLETVAMRNAQEYSSD